MTKKILLFPISVLFVCVTIYAIGFTIFSLNTITPQTSGKNTADAVVILTGGENRIKEGLKLFDKKNVKNILISGVGKDIKLNDILPDNYQAYQCCLTLGYEALDTIGNAEESYIWLKKNGFKSFYLTTSSYHLPRASLIFRKHPEASKYDMHTYPAKPLNDDIKHAAFWRIIFEEYNKLLYTWITIRS